LITPRSALPIGSSQMKDIDIHTINMKTNMENIIIALSHGLTPEEVLIASIAGFIQI